MSSREEELLEELVKWVRLLGMQEVKGVLLDALKYDDEEKEKAAMIAYQLTNGENSTKDIAEYIPFSYRWVSYRHNEWVTLGIIDKKSHQEPYEHIISLDSVGIEYPEISEAKQSSEEELDTETQPE